jgi:SAM-dependent methyltransferase
MTPAPASSELAAAPALPPLQAALQLLAPHPPEVQLEIALRRLRGQPGGELDGFPVGSERAPELGALDGRLLEAICGRALAGAQGAVFTAGPEARILAAFGLANAAELRGGPAPASALEMLLGLAPATAQLTHALDGLRVLDPACGGGALLATAAVLAQRCGARLALRAIDLSPLATRACAERLALLGERPELAEGDALAAPWPDVELVIANPPFVRHEALAPEAKAQAVRASGLSRQADLSAHFTAVALARAPVAALVWPRALFTSRSTAPMIASARGRGGFALALRSRVAGSFAASVDTLLAVWRAGAASAPETEAAVALSELTDGELLDLARGCSGPRLRTRRALSVPTGAVTVGDVCQVRFGLKTGCNAFFHLRPLGDDRYASALAGEVRLEPEVLVRVLATLREARAPARLEPSWRLFKPPADGPLPPGAQGYLELGESLGVHLRPTCASRPRWWCLAPGRAPAPVLYPAKLGTRAFAVLNADGLWEDKKWHALFPGELEPWLLALVLASTPVRLAVELGARQLTGAQAIADVDCRVLAAAPFPSLQALAPLVAPLEACWRALACDPISTDLRAMLARPAQQELDRLAGQALGLSAGAVDEARQELQERIEARLEHAAQVRAALR